MKKFLLTCAAASCAMMMSAQSYTVVAQAIDESDWDEYGYANMLGAGDAVTVEVDAEGQSVTIPDWIGSGMDLILCYNDDEEVTSVIPVIDGVEGTEIFPDPDYDDFYFKFPSDFKYASVSLMNGYCYVGVYENEGYVFLGAYLYDADYETSAAYYSIEWTKEEEELVIIYDTEAEPACYEEWGTEDEFFIPQATVAIGVCEGNQIILEGWTGATNDVLLIKYDDEENITALTPWTDGEKGETVTEGKYGSIYIDTDDYYYCSPYVGADYAYAAADEEGGYVIFGAYFYPVDGGDAEWLYYYIEWSTNGVASVEVSKEMPAVYYNLNGVRIDNPSAPGIYIKSQGTESSKVLVK